MKTIARKWLVLFILAVCMCAFSAPHTVQAASGKKEQRLGQGDIMDHTPIKVYIGLYNDRKTAKQNEKTEMVGKILIQIHIISSFAQKHSYSHYIIAHISRYCNKKFTNKNKKVRKRLTYGLLMAPPVGLEPTTLRLTAACSTN